MKNGLKIVVSVSLAGALAACATKEVVAQPHATEGEKQTAVKSYMNCLIPYAKRLDDGKSDAKTIAQAMRGACLSEMELVAEAMSRGENNAVKQRIRQGMASMQESSALQVVLEVRHSQPK